MGSTSIPGIPGLKLILIFMLLLVVTIQIQQINAKDRRQEIEEKYDLGKSRKGRGAVDAAVDDEDEDEE